MTLSDRAYVRKNYVIYTAVTTISIIMAMFKPAYASPPCYMAIAYAPSNGSVGQAQGQIDRGAAERAAKLDCPSSSCKIVVWGADGCAALAVSSQDRSVYAAGWSSGMVADIALESAKWAALDSCSALTGGGSCYILTKVCSYL